MGLHSDADQTVANLLISSMREGLIAPAKRTSLPSQYICLVQEYMNRGTVQDWMDEDRLLPGGLLAVMQHVAAALSYMHSLGVSHNDVKPQNILLAQEDESNSQADVTVKLGDLGLAARSTDH